MFTKDHYNRIAMVLSKQPNDEAHCKQRIVEDLDLMFGLDNPRYQSNKFKVKCFGKPLSK
jgi:hypothetical protein